MCQDMCLSVVKPNEELLCALKEILYCNMFIAQTVNQLFFSSLHALE